MRLKQIMILLLLSSCALFREQPSLNKMDKEKLLDSVTLIGEGRGRLSFGQSQYLFGFDSLLKEGKNWILAVQIPLHGEEVMVFPDLTQKRVSAAEMESFEARIKNEFEKVKLNKIISSKTFLQELRVLVRFGLSSSLGLERNCKAQHKELLCELDGDVFTITTTDENLLISRTLSKGSELVLAARNLTDSIFQQTNIFLYSTEANAEKKKHSFGLELFWKN